MNKIVNQIVILNGGKGSRVKSIASGKPKCLIDINNKPFLYRQLKLIKKNNVKNVVICCGFNKADSFYQTIPPQSISRWHKPGVGDNH